MKATLHAQIDLSKIIHSCFQSDLVDFLLSFPCLLKLLYSPGGKTFEQYYFSHFVDNIFVVAACTADKGRQGHLIHG